MRNVCMCMNGHTLPNIQTKMITLFKAEIIYQQYGDVTLGRIWVYIHTICIISTYFHSVRLKEQLFKSRAVQKKHSASPIVNIPSSKLTKRRLCVPLMVAQGESSPFLS